MSNIVVSDADILESRKCFDKILDHFSENDWHLNNSVMIKILSHFRAEAVKAERERCTDVARKWYDDECYDDDGLIDEISQPVEGKED